MNTQKPLQNPNFRNNQNYVLDNDREMIIINNYWHFFSKQKSILKIIFLIIIWLYVIILIIIEINKIKLNNPYIFYFILALIIFFYLIQPKYNYSVYIKNIKAINILFSTKDIFSLLSKPLFNTNDPWIKENEKLIKKAFIILYIKKKSFLLSFFLKIFLKITIKIIIIFKKIWFLFIKKSK